MQRNKNEFGSQPARKGKPNKQQFVVVVIVRLKRNKLRDQPHR